MLSWKKKRKANTWFSLWSSKWVDWWVEGAARGRIRRKKIGGRQKQTDYEGKGEKAKPESFCGCRFESQNWEIYYMLAWHSEAVLVWMWSPAFLQRAILRQPKIICANNPGLFSQKHCFRECVKNIFNIFLPKDLNAQAFYLAEELPTHQHYQQD